MENELATKDDVVDLIYSLCSWRTKLYIRYLAWKHKIPKEEVIRGVSNNIDYDESHLKLVVNNSKKAP